jgi:hypothetical protein
VYLHEEREQFLDAVRMAAGYTGMSEIAIEKDYYVTMILRLLSQKLPLVEMDENFKKLVGEVSYEMAIQAIEKIQASGMFAKDI